MMECLLFFISSFHSKLNGAGSESFDVKVIPLIHNYFIISYLFVFVRHCSFLLRCTS